MSTVKYPDIYVRLVHEDGNAFSILARVTSAMKRNGLGQVEIDEFISTATAGSYDNLLRTVCDWFAIDWDMPRKDDDTDDDGNDWSSEQCGWCAEAHEDCECGYDGDDDE